LTFEDAQRTLLAGVRDRIRNGELTERRFARLIGISQPHAHNVLKGVRKLSPQVCDAILRFFHMSLLDLASLNEFNLYLQRKIEERYPEVPFLETPVGPGMPWPAGMDRQKSFPLPFPSVIAPPNLVMANLLADPEMYSTFSGYDIALLDTSELQRLEITPEGLYIVDRGNEAVARYVRPGARVHYAISDLSLPVPANWERLAVPARERTSVIRARVQWMGREHDRALPVNQRGRFLYDPISW